MQSIGLHAGHHICLTSTSRADIICWYLFAEKWNGIFPYSGIATPCSLISIFIQMHLVPRVVEVIRAVWFQFNCALPIAAKK